ncbi:uncharacterized protein LOC112876904 isoform X2 [Panicum hallii]|uniref:uncharacterized protein LOC112876904 isoform X2 n=1 Tax=Panicum hallii TaxID=206008 RepID=UPI000DF4D6F0|nr:uncharacterized protein LOC112876904 isoform X2 [Panicum hallii]
MRNQREETYQYFAASEMGCAMASGSDDLHQCPQPDQILGVSFFMKSETEEMNFSEKFDVELNEPYLVFKLCGISYAEMMLSILLMDWKSSNVMGNNAARKMAD